MDDELRERILTALFWAEPGYLGPYNWSLSFYLADSIMKQADALAPIIAEVKAAAVERCAKVAEDDRNTWGVVTMPPGNGVTLLAEPRVIAAAIRAQKEPTP